MQKLIVLSLKGGCFGSAKHMEHIRKIVKNVLKLFFENIEKKKNRTLSDIY